MTVLIANSSVEVTRIYQLENEQILINCEEQKIVGIIDRFDEPLYSS